MGRTAWVQCEEPSCGKWRRVPLTVAQSMKEDEPWCVSRARSKLCRQFAGLKVSLAVLDTPHLDFVR